MSGKRKPAKCRSCKWCKFFIRRLGKGLASHGWGA